jgi:PASTA domain
MQFRHVIVAAFLLASLSGCGGREGGTATVTVVERTVVVTADTVAAPGRDASTGTTQASGEIRVPNVVGKNHQYAQDTMQAAGLYNLAEEDATGQGRMLLFDRNWFVVTQDPPAGTLVNEDQTITLRSKKYGE